MKVCAEYEEQVAAFTAHRSLLDNGADPEDIEIRSPYPLSEHPIPPHRSKPMIVRNVARVFWLLGLIGGFSFITTLGHIYIIFPTIHHITKKHRPTNSSSNQCCTLSKSKFSGCTK